MNLLRRAFCNDSNLVILVYILLLLTAFFVLKGDNNKALLSETMQQVEGDSLSNDSEVLEGTELCDAMSGKLLSHAQSTKTMCFKKPQKINEVSPKVRKIHPEFTKWIRDPSSIVEGPKRELACKTTSIANQGPTLNSERGHLEGMGSNSPHVHEVKASMDEKHSSSTQGLAKVGAPVGAPSRERTSATKPIICYYAPKLKLPRSDNIPYYFLATKRPQVPLPSKDTKKAQVSNVYANGGSKRGNMLIQASKALEHGIKTQQVATSVKLPRSSLRKGGSKIMVKVSGPDMLVSNAQSKHSEMMVQASRSRALGRATGKVTNIQQVVNPEVSKPEALKNDVNVQQIQQQVVTHIKSKIPSFRQIHIFQGQQDQNSFLPVSKRYIKLKRYEGKKCELP